MAKETGFAPDYVKEAGEYAPGSFLSSAFSNRMFGPTNEDILWERQCKVITDLAAKGPCVIVGRCADYVLRDEDVRLLKVFVAAPDEHRIQRKMAQEKLSRDQAVRLIRKMDKQRRKYYESYTGRTWGAPNGYDLYLDTGTMSTDEAAARIAARFRQM